MKTKRLFILAAIICIASLFSVDLTYAYHPVSPYAFCNGNPIRYVDPDGKMVGDFMDEKGRYLGNDGIDDNKVYVVKTAQTNFGQGNSIVPGAGNTEVKATIAFIKANSGNTAAFTNNPIAYNNSIQIEGAATNRQAMVTAVGLDTGGGGTSAANNREYGGSISNGAVVVATPGAVANPQTDASASIMLPNGVSTFHSHPSGNVVVGSGINTLGGTTTTYGFTQSPSPQDISVAGAQTHYVFGRGNNIVYIYNSQGVQATLPMTRFVSPKK